MLEFDEAFYLEKNPDVAEAVRRGDWPSGFTHYCVTGKAKGRAAARPVDADWYVSAYHGCTGNRRRKGHLCGGSLLSARQISPLFALATWPSPRQSGRVPFSLWRSMDRCWKCKRSSVGTPDLGQITQKQETLLTKWINDGYVILPDAVPDAILNNAEAELDRAYRGEIPGFRYAVHGVSQNCEWSPEAVTQPAKALDIHWFSAPIRQLIFTEQLLAFLHLIFERRVLASQTLGFWRGSAQEAHQDSAYVNYSLPMQFAASWIALEDVREGR